MCSMSAPRVVGTPSDAADAQRGRLRDSGEAVVPLQHGGVSDELRCTALSSATWRDAPSLARAPVLVALPCGTPRTWHRRREAFARGASASQARASRRQRARRSPVLAGANCPCPHGGPWWSLAGSTRVQLAPVRATAFYQPCRRLDAVWRCLHRRRGRFRKPVRRALAAKGPERLLAPAVRHRRRRDFGVSRGKVSPRECAQQRR